jgi:hypothetical protein
MDEQRCYRGATRMTAAERQFERFVCAVRQFECDNSSLLFEQALARLVVAGRSRPDGLTLNSTTGFAAPRWGEISAR